MAVELPAALSEAVTATVELPAALSEAAALTASLSAALTRLPASPYVKIGQKHSIATTFHQFVPPEFETWALSV